MLHLQKLVLHKFPHVAPGTTLEFGPGLNLLLGKNGTGKTTLLKLLSRVAALDFADLQDEGDYKLECHVDYGCYSLELHVESRLVEPVEPSADHRTDWAYQGWLRNASGETLFQFAHGAGQEPRTTPVLTAHPEHPMPGLSSDFPKLLQECVARAQVAEAEDDQARHYRSAAAHGLFGIYCMASDAHVGRLDDALVAYDSFAGAAPPRELRVPAPPELSTLCLFDGIPGARNMPADLAEAAAGSSWHEPATTLSIDLASIPSLANFATTAGFHGATIEIGKPEEAGHDQMRHRTYTDFKLRVALDSETSIPGNRLSFGQKRLFAFYWYLACIPEGVVLADELVTGFHHSWIAACLDEIGDRQAILASQNPLLLDLLTFDDAEQVRRSFVLCSLEGNEDGGRPWYWQNMSPDSAGEFFRSYEAGLQHVSEILRVGGWW